MIYNFRFYANRVLIEECNYKLSSISLQLVVDYLEEKHKVKIDNITIKTSNKVFNSDLPF